jgi:hypothetical protein
MIENQVHTKVTADASQANAEMGKFQKALDAVGRAGRSIGSQVRMAVDDAAVAFGKFNLAMGGVQMAVGLVNSAMDTAFEQNRLDRIERVLPAGIVDRFRAATDKLISRQDALRLSIKGLTGDFKLTEPEMQKVLQAAVALQEKGFGPAAEVTDKLLEALVKGVDTLDEYGIALEKTGNRQYDVNAAFEKFDELIQTNHVDESTKNLAALKDSLESIGQEIKSVVTEAAKGIAWLAAQRSTETGKRVRQMAFGWLDYIGPQPKQVEDPLVAYNRQLSESEVSFDAGRNDPRARPLGPAYDGQGMTDEEWIAREKWRAEQLKKKPKGGGYKPGGQNIGEHAVDLPSWVGGDFGGQGDFGAAAWDSTSLDFLEAQQQSRGYGPNESFGYVPKDELADLRKELQDTSTAAGASYAALSSGIAAAVDAAITGSDSIGRAAAKASGGVLKALAVEATGKAAWYALEAAGYGIMGNAAKASASLALAGGYAAEAVALGGLAAGLGALAGGGGGGGARPGYGAGAAGGGYMSHGGGGGGDAISITVNVGDGFGGTAGGDVSKQVAEGVSRALRQAERQGSRRSYTTATYSG